MFTCGSGAGFVQFLQLYDSAGFLGVDFDIEDSQSQADIKTLVARAKAARSRVQRAAVQLHNRDAGRKQR